MFAHMDEVSFRDYTHGTVLAPMAGSTDSAFRRICRRMGATAVVTEMVAAAGVSRRSVKTHKLLRFHEEEKPIGIQLFGRRPEDFSRAAHIVSGMGFDFIDINAGCPVKKVVRSGSGSALLRDVPALAAIVRATSEQTHLPVTVKIRLGWSPAEPVPDSLPSILAGEGASALAVHGRFRSDMFGGKVRIEEIRRIAECSGIPVVANGDIRNISDARELEKGTGASGIMVGRGSMGNPWIFRSLSEGRDYRPGPEEVVAVIREQFGMMREYIPEEHVYHILRGQLLNYIRGFRGASELRGKATGVATSADLEDILVELETKLSLDSAEE
jgi:tRNA-dihydrouridine synthase B